MVHGRCEGTLAHGPRGSGGFGYDPAFVPDDYSDGRTMAELSADEKDAISHRGRAARELARKLRAAEEADRPSGPLRALLGDRARERRQPGGRLMDRFARPATAAAVAAAPGRAVGLAAQAPRKERAAAVSIISNTLLIALKVVAGVVTGSIAILTEAAHSAIDLVASVIAFFWFARPRSRPTSPTPTATTRSRTWPRASREC